MSSSACLNFLHPAGWRYSSIEGGQQHVLSDAGSLAALKRVAVDGFDHLQILGDIPQCGDGAKLRQFLRYV
jgi:hypothetical protein